MPNCTLSVAFLPATLVLDDAANGPLGMVVAVNTPLLTMLTVLMAPVALTVLTCTTALVVQPAKLKVSKSPDT